MPTPPRYTDRPLPPYRYLPGREPHPTRDPAGHSFGDGDSVAPPLAAAEWPRREDYRYGVDLFNAGYWWEAHEVFESLWHASGRQTPVGHCLQAFIQCAAAHIQAELQHARGARNLLRRAARHAEAAGSDTLGADLVALLAESRRFVTEPGAPPAQLRLALPD